MRPPSVRSALGVAITIPGEATPSSRGVLLGSTTGMRAPKFCPDETKLDASAEVDEKCGVGTLIALPVTCWDLEFGTWDDDMEVGSMTDSFAGLLKRFVDARSASLGLDGVAKASISSTEG
jgi:hypothetical protein